MFFQTSLPIQALPPPPPPPHTHILNHVQKENLIWVCHACSFGQFWSQAITSDVCGSESQSLVVRRQVRRSAWGACALPPNSSPSPLRLHLVTSETQWNYISQCTWAGNIELCGGMGGPPPGFNQVRHVRFSARGPRRARSKRFMYVSLASHTLRREHGLRD